jgi:hypothetical protein
MVSQMTVPTARNAHSSRLTTANAVSRILMQRTVLLSLKGF